MAATALMTNGHLAVDDTLIDCNISELHYGKFKAVRDVHVKVEEELNKARVFQVTLTPGQTLADNNIPPGQRPEIVWRFRPNGFWDGLNVTAW